MRFSEDMATRDFACQRPWFNQPRTKSDDARHDDDAERFAPPVTELRAALADGLWHDSKIAHRIADTYGVTRYTLIDRAGCYSEKGRIIWPAAMN